MAGRLVGEFPDPNFRTIRGPVNPMDKSTVVSILPKSISEKKPTIQPGLFEIEAGSYEKPSLLVVGPSSWWKQLEENQPLLEIPTGSVQIGDSIIKDYCNGLLGCNMGDAMPGLFFIPGEITLIHLLKDHKKLLDNARENQKRWFTALIKIADSLWARSMGNPLAVPDDSRMAARELGFKDKPWIKDIQLAELIPCKACGAMRNPVYPICQTCKVVIDEVKAKELNLRFAS